MKGGLAIIMGMKPKGGAKAPPSGPPAPDDEAAEGEEPADGGSEKQYAKLAAEAIADGDTEAAADALVSMVKACLKSYGP